MVIKRLTSTSFSTDLDAWLGILHSQRYVAEHTLAAYRRDLNKLINFLVKQGCEEWAELDQDRLIGVYRSIAVYELTLTNQRTTNVVGDARFL
jgi:site-specific recombinase XerC